MDVARSLIVKYILYFPFGEILIIAIFSADFLEIYLFIFLFEKFSIFAFYSSKIFLLREIEMFFLACAPKFLHVEVFFQVRASCEFCFSQFICLAIFLQKPAAYPFPVGKGMWKDRSFKASTNLKSFFVILLNISTEVSRFNDIADKQSGKKQSGGRGEGRGGQLGDQT